MNRTTIRVILARRRRKIHQLLSVDGRELDIVYWFAFTISSFHRRHRSVIIILHTFSSWLVSSSVKFVSFVMTMKTYFYVRYTRSVCCIRRHRRRARNGIYWDFLTVLCRSRNTLLPAHSLPWNLVIEWRKYIKIQNSEIRIFIHNPETVANKYLYTRTFCGSSIMCGENSEDVNVKQREKKFTDEIPSNKHSFPGSENFWGVWTFTLKVTRNFVDEGREKPRRWIIFGKIVKVRVWKIKWKIH